MLVLTLVLLATAFVAISANNNTMSLKEIDPATDQIVLFKERYMSPIGILTTSSGEKVPYTDATKSLKSILMTNHYLIERLAHLNRERIPERVVHAKGAGAFGYFEVTHDISHICKAEMFSKIGKKTPVAVRFSGVVAEKGGSDVLRDVRGFAVKFYTQDGNFDIVGNNMPVFVVKDPVKFPNFVHAVKRNPSTNLKDFKTFWDFFTLNPEGFHLLLYFFGDRGIPASYVNMPGYSIHTYQVENDQGKPYFVRFHFIPDAGIKNLTTEEAKIVGAEDPDYHSRILYRSVAKGQFPSWTVSVQILTLDDVKQSQFNVFDVTRVLSKEKYPLKQVGKLVLDKNAKNFFAEIEQLAFSPGNLITGIRGDPSKLFESRRFSYPDAQYYRLGVNFNKISVNCPYRTKTLTLNRDGSPPIKDNEEDIPNYYPNTFNGPVPFVDTCNSQLIKIVEKSEPNNFDQATEMYTELTTDEQSRLVINIVSTLKFGTPVTQKRAVAIFGRIHSDLGRMVAQELKANKNIEE